MRVLRLVFLVLLLSLLVGFAIGTLIRMRLEKPVYYIGAVTEPASGAPDAAPIESEMGV